MPKAKWNGKVIAKAEKDEVEKVEGNVYFPLSAIKGEYFKESSHQTTCPWKGQAGYFHIKINGKTNENAAWIYRDPKDAANHIKDHVAFWKGVDVEE